MKSISKSIDMSIIKTMIRALEKPAARRARLSREHAQRKAQRMQREATQREEQRIARGTRQGGRNPYPFHV